MKMLGEITDCERLEISQENFCDEVSSSKVTNLQCSDCNFELTTASFLEYVPKTSCLKKNKKSIFLRKKPMMYQRLIKFAVL